MGLSLHLPSPKRFFWLFPLPFGIAVIHLITLINKAAAVYGIIALATGVPLTATQVSMYIQSLICLGLLIWVVPGVLGPVIGFPAPTSTKRTVSRRRKSGRGVALARGKAGLAAAGRGGPEREEGNREDEAVVDVVVFAWVYVVDFVVNAAYTAWFAVGWYIAAAAALEASQQQQKELQQHASSSQNGQPHPAHSSNGTMPSGNETLHPIHHTIAPTPPREDITSITIIALIWLIRTYFLFIVLSYSRNPSIPTSFQPASIFPLRNHSHNEIEDLNDDEPPPSVWERVMQAPGVKGKLGRRLVGVTPRFWAAGIIGVARDLEGGKAHGLGETEAWLRFRDFGGDGGVRAGSSGSSSGSSRSESVRGD